MPFEYWTKFCPVIGTPFEYRTGIQMVVWKPNYHLYTWHLNAGQVKVHYSDVSIIQMFIQIPCILFVFVLLAISKLVFVNWILFFIAGQKWLLLLLSWFHSVKKMPTSKKGNGCVLICIVPRKILQLYMFALWKNQSRIQMVLWSVIWIQWGSEIWIFPVFDFNLCPVFKWSRFWMVYLA